MELRDTSVNIKSSNGNDTFELPAGKGLKIETYPEGEEKLGVVIPEGESWRFNINVSVIKTIL